jgi:hypothetical protein
MERDRVRIEAHIRSLSDSELLDDLDEIYDEMVAAGEAGNGAERDRLASIHDIALDVANARNLIIRDV